MDIPKELSNPIDGRILSRGKISSFKAGLSLFLKDLTKKQSFSILIYSVKDECSRYDSLRMIPSLSLYLRTKVLRTGTVIFYLPN